MQPEPTPGVVSVHHQIADAIRIKIATGVLKPGDSVPSVSDLCGKWHCAPGSARSAIDVLKSEGLITGGRGRAATVRQQPQRIRLSIDMTQEQKDLVLRSAAERAQRGATATTLGTAIEQTNSTHRYQVVPASEELAAEFQIEAGAELLQRGYEMTDRESGQRLAWSISYLPVELIRANPDLFDEDKEPWPGGHQHQLYTVGIELDRVVRSVTAVEPTPGDRKKWGMESGVPLLGVRSRSIDTTDRVVEISDAKYPADRTDLSFTERLQRWPEGYPKYDQDAGRS